MNLSYLLLFLTIALDAIAANLLRAAQVLNFNKTKLRSNSCCMLTCHYNLEFYKCNFYLNPCYSSPFIIVKKQLLSNKHEDTNYPESAHNKVYFYEE